MHIVDYFVIAGYFALVMYLGYYSMKKVSSFDDYAVAGRSMPLPIFFAAIAATLCGGGANHRAYLFYAYYRDHRVLRAYRRRHQPDFLRVVHLRARPQRREKCLQPRGPVWDLLWAFRSLAFQCVRIPVLRRGVRGTDPGDGRHPPDRHGHQPHPRRADRLDRDAGLYVVGRHPRRNPHRRRAVRHHRHRGYALRLSRHRSPRRVRRHDVDPLLQPAL